jgi:hypothetical protein
MLTPALIWIVWRGPGASQFNWASLHTFLAFSASLHTPNFKKTPAAYGETCYFVNWAKQLFHDIIDMY